MEVLFSCPKKSIKLEERDPRKPSSQRGTSSPGVDDKYGQLDDHLNVKYKNHAAVRYE